MWIIIVYTIVSAVIAFLGTRYESKDFYGCYNEPDVSDAMMWFFFWWLFIWFWIPIELSKKYKLFPSASTFGDSKNLSIPKFSS